MLNKNSELPQGVVQFEKILKCIESCQKFLQIRQCETMINNFWKVNDMSVGFAENPSRKKKTNRTYYDILKERISLKRDCLIINLEREKL